MRPSEPKVVLAKKLSRDKTISLDNIFATLKMSELTLYRYVAMNPSQDVLRKSLRLMAHTFWHGHIVRQCP